MREDRLIRKLLGRVVVVALVVGMTVAAPIAVEGAATAASASITICGFLDDGSGAGSAASLDPGATPQAGLQFSQQITGAWQLCWDNGDREVTLFAYEETWCMADDNGYAKLRSCNGNFDQQWTGPSATSMGSFQLKNANGGVLCAQGGLDAIDKVLAPSNCSDYHETWNFEGSA